MRRKKEFITNLQTMQKEAPPHSREELFDILSMLVDMQLNEKPLKLDGEETPKVKPLEYHRSKSYVLQSFRKHVLDN